jgi:hypothetical protein
MPPQIDSATSLIVTLALTTFCANAVITDGDAFTLINGGLGLNVVDSIQTIWSMRNALVKSTAIPDKTKFPIGSILNNISIENFKSNNTIINVLMSLVDEEGTQQFSSLIGFYKQICASTESTLLAGGKVQDLRNIAQWAESMSIVTDRTITAADLKTLCDTWASVNQRMTFASTIEGNASTTVPVVVAKSVENDNVGYTQAVSTTAATNKTAYLTAALNAGAVTPPAGDSLAQILTAVIKAMDDIFAPTNTLAIGGALTPQVKDATDYTPADYDNKSSVHIAFLLLKKLWAEITPDLYVTTFGSSTPSPLNLLVWENYITLNGISKLGKSISDVITFVGNATYTAVGANNLVAYDLPNYNLPSQPLLVASNPTFSAFHGLFVVLKTLGFAVAEVFEKCVAKINVAFIAKEGIPLSATGDLSTPAASQLRAANFDSVFNNFIKNLPLQKRLLTNLGTTTAAAAPSNTFLLGTDLPSDIFDTVFINSRGANKLYTTPTAITVDAGKTIAVDILYAASVAVRVVDLNGSNTLSTYGAPVITHDILYSKALNRNTAVYSNVVANMFDITQTLGDFPKLVKKGTAPYDAVPTVADQKLKLSQENFDNLLGLFATSIKVPLVNMTLGHIDTLQTKNQAEVLFNTLFVTQKVPLQTILDLAPGNWSNGVSPISLFTEIVRIQKIHNGTASVDLTATQKTVYNQAYLDLAKSNLGLVNVGFTALSDQNKVVLLNVLVPFVRNDADRNVILSLMGTTKKEQATILKSMVTNITYGDKTMYSFFFKNFSVSDLIEGGFGVPSLAEASTAIIVTSELPKTWPVFYKQNVSSLVGPNVTNPLVPAETVLAYRQSITSVNKQTGLNVGGGAVTSLVFSPASVQEAYGLSDSDLSSLMSELSFNFV